MRLLVQLAIGTLFACAEVDAKKTKTTSVSPVLTYSTTSCTQSPTTSTSLAASSTSLPIPSPSPTGLDQNGMIFDYPYPVHFFNFTSQRQNLSMAYMDVSSPNGSTKGTLALLHGKNFCGATWNQSISTLVAYGYRVIIPDQIGFCKSTKPFGYTFTLFQLALNTNSLLTSLNISSATIMGHSMGGMISARYALMFPSQTTRLIMVDPLGLENWFAKGVPYQAIDITYQTELATTFASIQSYENSTYYSGQWEERYTIWVQMLYDVYTGSHGVQFAYNMAQATDMVFTSPILQEFGNLAGMQSLLLVGKNDNTAIGKAWAPVALRPSLGNYSLLGEQAHALIGSNNTLVEFEGLGHAPHIEDPETFFAALLAWLP